MPAKKKAPVREVAKTSNTTRSSKTKASNKPAAKKASPKKSASKNASKATPKTTAKKPAKLGAIPNKMTKAQIYAHIAESLDIEKKLVKSIFEELRDLAGRHLKPRGSGEFRVPELNVNIKRVRKKATKARPGRNPFTGEEIMIAAKPARNSVRATALKALKDLAEVA